ncbi:CPBP family intramembrane glutamic endopeptidase [Aestuariivivens sediminis]|uniref:CPBP family intramembrane glutamic endopeptidase n=1 Tax=Aestuariivivens sediminis TaxID=2913557 RepID=UPI001F57BA1A|nr:CPBP family intramembrane glutamic endopeptidase [Aestuariivivens sediminis]
MNTLFYKIIEFFIIFIAMPIAFIFDYPIWIKLSVGLLGFMYIIYILVTKEQVDLKINKDLNWYWFWKQTLLKLCTISVLTTIFVWFTNKVALFHVIINKPGLWLFILFVYSVLSVYPQEIVYRTFFFKRYAPHIRHKKLLWFTNALIFSIGHMFFKNELVLVLTFLGGLLFAMTYYKTNSTFLVSIEHAIYGCWLFTVGMGEMLGFPQ